MSGLVVPLVQPLDRQRTLHNGTSFRPYHLVGPQAPPESVAGNVAVFDAPRFTPRILRILVLYTVIYATGPAPQEKYGRV